MLKPAGSQDHSAVCLDPPPRPLLVDDHRGDSAAVTPQLDHSAAADHLNTCREASAQQADDGADTEGDLPSLHPLPDHVHRRGTAGDQLVLGDLVVREHRRVGR